VAWSVWSLSWQRGRKGGGEKAACEKGSPCRAGGASAACENCSPCRAECVVCVRHQQQSQQLPTIGISRHDPRQHRPRPARQAMQSTTSAGSRQLREATVTEAVKLRVARGARAACENQGPSATGAGSSQPGEHRPAEQAMQSTTTAGGMRVAPLVGAHLWQRRQPMQPASSGSGRQPEGRQPREGRTAVQVTQSTTTTGGKWLVPPGCVQHQQQRQQPMQPATSGSRWSRMAAEQIWQLTAKASGRMLKEGRPVEQDEHAVSYKRQQQAAVRRQPAEQATQSTTSAGSSS